MISFDVIANGNSDLLVKKLERKCVDADFDYVSDILEELSSCGDGCEYAVSVFSGCLLFGLFYMPLSISADKYAIYVHRSFRIKAIPIQEVKSVKLFPASLRAMRLCGSGGFMGYWGWFREPGIGRYFAYYGDPRDCFLIELSNGKKYVLGCRNAGAMVEHIRGLMK